jgi:diaminopimelate epimerase
MRLEFTKLHGCGNDYLFVDCTERALEGAADASRFVSERRTGVGSDGLICIYPSATADFRMEMYNADGSRGEMCGNGIRGVGKYVFDRGLTRSRELSVETDAGVKKLWLEVESDRVRMVRVDMGIAELDGPKIPVRAEGRVIDQPLTVAGRVWNVTCVSMGNPHCVTFDEDPERMDLLTIGPPFEHHEMFPNRINTEFVRVDTPDHLTMRVWERGSGETMACGTGACAVLVAAVLTGRSEAKATVALRGGDLEIEVDAEQRVFMTGPSVDIFSGAIDIPEPGAPAR